MKQKSTRMPCLVQAGQDTEQASGAPAAAAAAAAAVAAGVCSAAIRNQKSQSPAEMT